ncbi:MAG: ABC transporter permease [Clostridia bacterium]|nr:ABC transporter permease [Clostridia bacterium]
MDIFTIVKANIKARKGQFIGLVLLVILCVSSIVAFYNVMQSSKQSLNDEYDYINVADEILFIERAKVTDEMLETLSNLDEIDHYVVTPVLGCHSAAPAGWDYSDRSRVYESTIMLQAKPDASTGIRYPQINENFTEKITDDYVINPGEVYLANGLASQINVHVGDKIEIACEGIRREFTIRGIIEEPCAAVTIGYKNVLVNEEDFISFYDEVMETYAGMGFEADYNTYSIALYKSDKSMKTNDFRRAVNEATGIYDYATATTERNEFKGYNGIITEIFATVLIIVAFILYIVLIVVVGNIITSAVRDNYKTLGILKANGFSAGKLRLVYIFQYLITEIVGIVIGLILGYALCGVLLNSFASFSGFIFKPHIDVVITLSIILGILLFSLIVIVLSTSKVSLVSPYKAISETGDDVYFANKMVNPITKRGLSLSIALRHITSSKLSYLGLVITAMILMVLLVFAQASGTAMSSKNTVISMTVAGEIYMNHIEHLTPEEQTEVLEYINSKVTLQDSVEVTSYYTSGEFGNIYTFLYKNGEEVRCISKGRAPIYDNEICIGTGIASSYEKEIGDTIAITYNGMTFEYLITGIISTTNDLGNVAAFGLEAAARIGFDERLDYSVMVLVIENPDNPNEWYPKDKAEELCTELNEKYDELYCIAPETSIFGSQIDGVIELIKYVIYLITIVIVFIIINMSCSKFFHNEIKQCGVMKANGFTSSSIRCQFAIRFAIVFTIGSLLGGVLSGIVLEPAFGVLFGIFGASTIHVDFHPSMYLIPLVFVMIISFICAYISSRKVKKVDVNVLITE